MPFPPSKDLLTLGIVGRQVELEPGVDVVAKQAGDGLAVTVP